MKTKLTILLVAIATMSFGQNTNPLFGKTPYINIARITTATTATHTMPTTNLKLMVTGGLYGSKIEYLKFNNDSVGTAANCFYGVTDTAGNNLQYMGGIVLAATNVSTTAIGDEKYITFSSPPFIIKYLQQIYVGCGVVTANSGINCEIQYFDY